MSLELDQLRSTYVKHESSDEPTCVVFRIPIIKADWSRIDQKEKVLEEFKELQIELDADSLDRQRITSELLDLLQAFVGLIRVEMADLIIDDAVDTHLIKFFKHHNDEHIDKIFQYGAERGWKVTL